MSQHSKVDNHYTKTKPESGQQFLVTSETRWSNLDRREKEIANSNVDEKTSKCSEAFIVYANKKAFETLTRGKPYPEGAPVVKDVGQQKRTMQLPKAHGDLLV
jgi:TRAP-type C4-dicarboxylate transport system substrate-binding protein